MVSEITTIGVIGAGQMGAGIAQVSASAGYKVILSDIALENAETAISKIDTMTAKAVAGDKMSADERETILGNISPSGAIEDLADCDLVIEAASEVEHVKTAIFAELCPVLKPEALLASNTSSISITRLAA
ncbi:MAG: 3-hydroxyacyl-CoA dehydrogenase NAD-binding domain-containing protein, partial [Pseudomonadota bacterium]